MAYKDKATSVAYSTQWAKDNPEKYKYNQWKSSLKRYYGITIEQYNELYFSTDGCCHICGIHQLDTKKKLNVDHCHDSGKVRGLLCGPCNILLGNAKDKVEVLQQAIKYLQRERI